MLNRPNTELCELYKHYWHATDYYVNLQLSHSFRQLFRFLVIAVFRFFG